MKSTILLSQLLAGESVQIIGGDPVITALACDSRRVKSGTCFFALPGARSDGQQFVALALQAGAAAVVVEPGSCRDASVRVESHERRALMARMASRFYGDPSSKMRTVGITGTNGKSSCAWILGQILEYAGMSSAILGTLGLMFRGVLHAGALTTPESIDLMAIMHDVHAQGADAFVMEVSSHALALERVAGVLYDVGIFTNLSHDHLDFHETLDAYFDTKVRLFDERLKPGGKSVINGDDPRGALLAARLNAITYRASEAQHVSIDGTGIRATVHGTAFHTPLLGRFNLDNVLACIAAAQALGVSLDVIVEALAHVRAVPGRLQSVGGKPLILVDYAHTPDALEKALLASRPLGTGQLWCVFGCGGDRDPHKRSIMGDIASRLADRVIITNDNPRSEDPIKIAKAIAAAAPRAHIELDRARAIAMAVHDAAENDVILIAGKGHENYQITGAVTRPFDDVKEATCAYQERNNV